LNGERVLYDDIGAGYAATRRADPRIADAIRRALGDAASVVNIGAGSGSYEPTGLHVVPVEPSETMIRTTTSPAWRCRASLPRQDEFDAGYRLVVAELT
jgi:hypothetical protein